MDLTEIRQNLDKIDSEMVSLLAKRMELIPKVAEYKKANNIQRFQPEREKQIIEAKRNMASELGMNPDLAEKVFRDIIEDAHRIEKGIMGE